MVLFGQSAGGASVEIHSYAWARDPIVKGYIPQSGTAGLTPLIGGGDTFYNWGNLTEKVGCGRAGTEKQKLECMQALPWERIVEGLKPDESCQSESGLGTFGPRVDGNVIFSVDEYERRARLGLFARLVCSPPAVVLTSNIIFSNIGNVQPVLIGNTDEEIGEGTGYQNDTCPSEPPEGVTPEQLGAIATAVAFTCPAKKAAAYRYGILMRASNDLLN